MRLQTICPCSSFPKLLRPAPIGHIAVRPHDPRIDALYPNALHRGILSQCMRNTTFPRPRPFYEALNKLICTVTGTLPGLSSAHRHKIRRLIWDRGEMTYDATMVDVDPHIDPNAIKSFSRHHDWIAWGPLDKNAGGAFGICKKFQAELFCQHFLESPRYSVLHASDCVDDASAYILSTVHENALAGGLKQYVPGHWRRMSAPYGYVIIKNKSSEVMGIIKIRPIISHFGSIMSRLGSLVSRGMTVLVKLGAELSSNPEIITMPEFMPFLRHVHSQSKQDPAAWEAAELDLEDMYLNIPKAQLPDAFQYLLQKVAVAPYIRWRSRRAVLDWVSVSRISKKLDTHGRAANQDAYTYVSVDLLKDYLVFELQGNHLFRAGSWVLAETHGIPMGGGGISAKLASLYLMTREMIALEVSLFGSRVLRTRYRDNIYFFGPSGSVYPHLHTWQDTLSAVYAIPVTFEQAGSTVDLLEVRVRMLTGGLGVTLRPKACDILSGQVTNILRWSDAFSTNTSFVLQSMIPAVMGTCRFWKISKTDVANKKHSTIRR